MSNPPVLGVLAPWVALLVACAHVPAARADCTPTDLGVRSYDVSADPVCTISGEFGFGALMYAPAQSDGGLSLSGNVGFRWSRLRLGAVMQYTFGGFDTSTSAYRLDTGPSLGVELLQAPRVILMLSATTTFSRAGTYRRKVIDPGEWVCEDSECVNDSIEFEPVPYVAYYGFSGMVALTLAFRHMFVQVAVIRSRWLWQHEGDPPHHQYAFMGSLGYAFSSGQDHAQRSPSEP